MPSKPPSPKRRPKAKSTKPRPATFLGALRQLDLALRALDASSMVIGGVAVIAYGVPRTTRDIDVCVFGGVAPAKVLSTFRPFGFSARVKDAIAFAARSQVLLLRHDRSQTDVDLSFGFTDFETSALARRRAKRWAGVAIAVAAPDDLAIFKLIAGRPRDLEDVEALVSLHRADMDLARVRRVLEALAESLEDDTPVRRWDALVRAK